MREKLSLRTRLLLPLGLMFLAALLAGGVSLQIFASAHEKWIGLLAIVASGIALMLVTGAIAHFTARSALKRLSQDNRSLLRRIVSLQDDERRDMARELHDELGPLLFGIRANTVALLEAIPPDNAELGSAAEAILRSVNALQQANRRILDRLRPLYIRELGLERGIQTLLQNASAQAPDLKLSSQIDARLNAIDALLSQTVYRVIQEAVTNVLRHARANAMQVRAAIEGRELIVEISDDGIGFPAAPVLGRGLTGMLERVRALSGTVQLLREDGRTCVRCRLPAGDSATGAETSEA
jgi:two-component system sensor histidine kinase UhpB